MLDLSLKMVNHSPNLIKTAVFNDLGIKWYHSIPLRPAALWGKGSNRYIYVKLNLLNSISLPVAMARLYFKCKKYSLLDIDHHYLAYTS